MSGTQKRIIIVTGSRAWGDWSIVNDALLQAKPDEIWTGDARGVDAIAARHARLRGIALRTWPADWAQLGRAAGVLRSREMIDAAPPSAIVLAFARWPLSASRGTAATVEFATRRRLLAYHIDADGQRRCLSTPRGGIQT